MMTWELIAGGRVLCALPLAQIHVLRGADCVLKHFLRGFDDHINFFVGSGRRMMCQYELFDFRLPGDECACLPCAVSPAAVGRVFRRSILCVADKEIGIPAEIKESRLDRISVVFHIRCNNHNCILPFQSVGQALLGMWNTNP